MRKVEVVSLHLGVYFDILMPTFLNWVLIIPLVCTAWTTVDTVIIGFLDSRQ